jgi:hypothetical protein
LARGFFELDGTKELLHTIDLAIPLLEHIDIPQIEHIITEAAEVIFKHLVNYVVVEYALRVEIFPRGQALEIRAKFVL